MGTTNARGTEGGNRGNRSPLANMAREAAWASIARRSDAFAALVGPIITEIRAAGATTLKEIVAGLNERQVPAARGGKWSMTQLQRVLERLGSAAEPPEP